VSVAAPALRSRGARAVPRNCVPPPATREQILAAAAQLFSHSGYANTTLRQIAQACGIQAGSIYYHFDGKDEIAAQVLDEGLAAVTTAVRQRLDALPLQAAAPALADLLRGVGCRTLGDVRALPRKGLQRRGGAALLALLDRAYGDAPDPQVWFEPPREFVQTLELLQRADETAQLDGAAQRLVQALAGWLAHQWLGATAFSLWLQHETRGRQAAAPTRLRVELGQPSRDAAQLMLLLRERLSRITLPAPVYGLQLRLDEAVSLAGQAAALPFGQDRSGARWHDARQDEQNFLALLDRLSARLGAMHVQRWACRADHRPEHAAQALPATEAPPRDITLPQHPRPAWLLPEPLRLAERDGRPVHGGPLLLHGTPERIEAGWFDGAPVCRDYHVATGADHRQRWVFRELRGPQAGWFLHGWFG